MFEDLLNLSWCDESKAASESIMSRKLKSERAGWVILPETFHAKFGQNRVPNRWNVAFVFIVIVVVVHVVVIHVDVVVVIDLTNLKVISNSWDIDEIESVWWWWWVV